MDDDDKEILRRIGNGRRLTVAQLLRGVRDSNRGEVVRRTEALERAGLLHRRWVSDTGWRYVELTLAPRRGGEAKERT